MPRYIDADALLEWLDARPPNATLTAMRQHVASQASHHDHPGDHECTPNCPAWWRDDDDTAGGPEIPRSYPGQPGTRTFHAKPDTMGVWIVLPGRWSIYLASEQPADRGLDQLTERNANVALALLDTARREITERR